MRLMVREREREEKKLERKRALRKLIRDSRFASENGNKKRKLIESIVELGSPDGSSLISTGEHRF